MSKDLTRVSRALGRELVFTGDKDRDLVLQTKGRVKINFGDKFIELFNGKNFTVGQQDLIKTIDGDTDISNEDDGFYYDKDSGTLYLKIGDEIITIISGGEMKGNFISFKLDQNTLTSDERDLAKKNIGSTYNTQQEALANNAGNGVVFIKSENKAYILYNGQFFPITNNTTINQDQIEKDPGDTSDRYYFDNTVTIDISNEGPALIINGLGDQYNIQLGDEINNTNIYHTEQGGVINSNNSFTIMVNDNRVITVKQGSVDFNAVINALKGIITDEIYSTNFELNQSGWGIWIDKTTGESYLQVDHIIGAEEELLPITYQEACEMMRDGTITMGKTYIMIDYQNEWEITKTTDVEGEYLYESFNPNSEDEPSKDPSQYDPEENNPEPIFGLDRNVRPILLTGVTNKKFSESIRYYYKADSTDSIQILYDIRYKEIPEIGPDEDKPDPLDFEDKGRIYYMRDAWNNEAPCDFKHFKNDDGKWVFNYTDGSEASSLNTNEKIVCANNRILDVTIRLADKINPMIMTGKSINNNTLGGTFEEVTIGDPDSIIEYNYFNGVIKKCNFVGTFVNNSIGCTMEECEFKDEVINNEFNKDTKKCVFNKKVTDNVFDMSFEECNFGIISSNQFTGSAIKCDFWNEKLQEAETKENQFMGDFSECKFLGNSYSNDMKVNTVEKCTFEKDFFANQIVGDIWSENTFKETLKNNVFQSDVVKLYVEGLMNVNHFMGRLENVKFYKPAGDTSYGLNDNTLNGTVGEFTCYCDFSHNTFVGLMWRITINYGDPGDDKRCLFNYNNFTMGSLTDAVFNHDFRHNDVHVEYCNNVVTNGIVSYNSFSTYRIDARFGTFKYNEVRGLTFTGEFLNDFERCVFCSMSGNKFREEPIKNATFRHSFSGWDFTNADAIKDLDLLYNEKHQVDVFYHNDKAEISCQACNGPIKGEIKMFNGLAKDIPEGWHICDGTEGTPDLTDKFIKAGLVAGETGGAEGGEVNIAPENIPSHSHEITLTFDTSSFSTTKVVAGNSIVDFVVDKGGSSNYCLYTGEKGGQNYWISNIGSEVAAALNNAIASITAGEGAAGGGEITPLNIEPPYYTLIFIMKL